MTGTFARDSTCDGGDSQITVSWSPPPRGTTEFLVHLDDADAPGAGSARFTHWLVYNIPLQVRSVSKPLPPGVILGKNDFGSVGYRGPCPPRGQEHHYTVRVYALKRRLHVNDSVAWSVIAQRVTLLAIASGSVTATYSR
jgi:Raf kinase inhibitor-like YbhB/YbcL family protein